MSELSPSHYTNTTSYDVIDRKTIKHVLARKDFYHNCYYVQDEGDDPLMIKDSTQYLRNQNANKKIWILKYETVYGEFLG